MERISYAKLNDGSWGIRVWNERGATGRTGQAVTVTKRSGECKTEILGSSAGTVNGGKTAYYRKGHSTAGYTRQEVEAAALNGVSPETARKVQAILARYGK